jgi:DNA-binding LytR/AlgR family response regulator
MEHALIVDSSLASRRELTNDIRESQLSSNIYEAKSVSDGLAQLSLGKIQACFIGPSVTEKKAVDFIKSGVEICNGSSCAFIGVLKPHQKYAQALIDAGAHATLSKPYASATFSEVVKKAIVTAQQSNLTTTRRAVGIIEVKLPLVVQSLSTGLIQIRDSIQMLSAHDPKWCPGEAEHHALKDKFLEAINHGEKSENETNQVFADAAARWFFNRLSLSTKEANERLRKQLLSTLS